MNKIGPCLHTVNAGRGEPGRPGETSQARLKKYSDCFIFRNAVFCRSERNTHKFPRGRRARHAPTALAGLERAL
jgi:hypothetical protein